MSRSQHSSNRKKTLNHMADRMDSKFGRHSSERTQEKLNNVINQLDDCDPDSAKYQRLMIRAERLQNVVDGR